MDATQKKGFFRGKETISPDSTALFVDKLPKGLHWKGLWHIAGRHGQVLSVFIARKRAEEEQDLLSLGWAAELKP
ncbi:hypothetical protein F3Y22_tig00111621pilonHSYRG00017 [Hibiscus syriacus]|uniref:Uncharacterized protein n=1 Tax=Hibiscus syriacus TaxID=106335 RepID=A0A6A2YCQ4_HIBSY|nr:hypothetical protein F3Y22_tig00111621pilonHSYRG00017 [Hibiscus syriacus]